ncbi:MAG TPA: hypothetical protein VMX94_10835 [Armatimonadota bacterium]|nr:hypothetical protein [Armatimonadota bacterium]
MLTRTKKALAASLAVIVLIGLAAYAQTAQQPRVNRQAGARQGMAGLGMHPQRFLLPPNKTQMARLAELLGLTEEQKQKIGELDVQFRSTVKPILEQRSAAVKELFQALQAPSPNKGALESAANKVEQADRAILSAEFDFWIGFKQVLTAQQQEALTKFMQEKMEKRPAGPGGRPGPRAR